jgi:hypothetical protein
MGPDDAGQAVAVDDRQRRDSQNGRVCEQFLAGRRAAQEGEVRRDRSSAYPSSEDSVEKPFVGSGGRILAVAGPKNPERSPASSSTWK